MWGGDRGESESEEIERKSRASLSICITEMDHEALESGQNFKGCALAVRLRGNEAGCSSHLTLLILEEREQRSEKATSTPDHG